MESVFEYRIESTPPPSPHTSTITWTTAARLYNQDQKNNMQPIVSYSGTTKQNRRRM